MNISFVCPTDKVRFTDSSEGLVCPKCSRKVYKKNDIYDFITEEKGFFEKWDDIFDVHAAQNGLVKTLFDNLLSGFLPFLLNHYAFSYIIRRYPKGTHLVELGCGEATLSRFLLRKGYAVALLDYSASALKRSIDHVKKLKKADNCIFIRDDFYGRQISFSDHYFDVGYNVGVIEHFTDPLKAISEMKRVSKRVICVVPAKGLYFKIGTCIRKMIERDASLWLCHTIYYTLKETEALFQQAGLKNIEKHTTRFMGMPLCHFVTGTSA